MKNDSLYLYYWRIPHHRQLCTSELGYARKVFNESTATVVASALAVALKTNAKSVT